MGRSPRRLTVADMQARIERAARIARGLGFTGTVEYRHAYSQAGGAQYGLASAADEDVLIVYAEAFDRDADPNDFSLEAIIAHERGHQLVARHPRISRAVGTVSLETEEVIASLLGAMTCQAEADRDALLEKALVELVRLDIGPTDAMSRVRDLWSM